MKSKKNFNLDFGLYNIDLKKIIKYYEQDLKDDWFLDPIHYNDLIRRNEDLIDYFQKNIEDNHGVFKPISRLLFDIPKDSGALRYSLETCFYDRIAFLAFGVTLIEKFDQLLHRRVFSHRYNCLEKGNNKSKYLFLYSINQWKKFDEYVRVDALHKTILATDIQNFYENIQIRTLKDTLLSCLKNISSSGKEKAICRFCIDSLCECLKAWAFNTKMGLPQNRDISSFLANIYMMPIDEFMINSGFDYYRYMDDIKIICNDYFQAREILRKLVGKLRDRGLNINPKKTDILEPDTSAHRAFIDRGEFKIERIDSLINSKKKHLVLEGFNEVKQLLLQLQNKDNLTSREYRFCINRIANFALCKDIQKPDGYFKEITDYILRKIPFYPQSSDQYFKYLVSIDGIEKYHLNVIVEYLLDSEKAIYGWQNYLLWKIVTYYDYCEVKLHSEARTIVEKYHYSDGLYSDENLAGAILYLGKCGDNKDRKLIAQKFSNYKNFFIQRHALIAIQTLKYRDIKKDIEGYIERESFGIYRYLNSLRTPLYITPPKSIRYTDLIREISSYA